MPRDLSWLFIDVPEATIGVDVFDVGTGAHSHRQHAAEST
jgi:hypothetical protein